MTAEPQSPSEPDDSLAAELDLWEAHLAADDRSSLADLINRVLDKGVVITGNVTISVAGVDLVYLGLNAVLTSISTARRRVRGGGLALPGEGGEGEG